MGLCTALGEGKGTWKGQAGLTAGEGKPWVVALPPLQSPEVSPGRGTSSSPSSALGALGSPCQGCSSHPAGPTHPAGSDRRGSEI